VGGSRSVADQERRLLQPLVDDAERTERARLERIHDRGVAGWLGEVLQKAIRPEEAVDLLVVEDDPAQRLEFFVLALRLVLTAAVGEVGEDDAGLRQLPFAMHEHRRLAHLVDLVTIGRRALDHRAEEIHPLRLPVRADQIEHQRGAVAIAGLREAMEFVFGHRSPRCCYRVSVTLVPATEVPLKRSPEKVSVPSGFISSSLMVRPFSPMLQWRLRKKRSGQPPSGAIVPVSAPRLPAKVMAQDGAPGAVNTQWPFMSPGAGVLLADRRLCPPAQPASIRAKPAASARCIARAAAPISSSG